MSTTIILVFAALMLIAGGIVGFELGDWAGYERGKKAGEALVAASMNAQGEALAKEALAARAPAEAAGAFARLRRDWCTNC